MEELINAISAISDALGTTSGWDIAGVIFSGAATIGAVAVLFQNHQTIELSRRDIQNSINLQMFDKMVDIANKIEKGDYSSTKMEIFTLFGEHIYNQIEKIRELQQQLKYKEIDYNHYKEIRENQGYDPSLTVQADEDGAPKELVKQAEEQEKKFASVTDGDNIYYNGDELDNEIRQVKSEINAAKKSLEDNVRRIMRDKVKTDDPVLLTKNNKLKFSNIKSTVCLKQYKKYIPIVVAVVVLIALFKIIKNTRCSIYLSRIITYLSSRVINWEAVSAGAAWTGVLLSFFALIFAIYVPIRIAKKQDKIELFKQRFALYHILAHCLIFADELGIMMEKPEDRYLIFLNSFDIEEQKQGNLQIKQCAMRKASERLEALESSEFLFEDKLSDKILALSRALALLLGDTNASDEEIEEQKLQYIAIATEFKERWMPEIRERIKIDKR